MKFTSLLLLLMITIAAASCGERIVRDNPREQYRQCIEQNPDNREKCDEQREAYQQRFHDKRDIYLRGSGTEEGFY